MTITINENTLDRLDNLEIWYSTIVNDLMKKSVKKATLSGKTWQIAPDTIPSSVNNNSLLPCVEKIITDDENEVRVVLNNKNTYEMCHFNHRDIVKLLGTKKELFAEGDLKKIQDMGDKFTKILLSVIKTIIDEASPYSQIVEIDSLSLCDPLCTDLYETSFLEVSNIYFEENSNRVMVTLSNKDEKAAENLTHYDLLQIIKEIA